MQSASTREDSRPSADACAPVAAWLSWILLGACPVGRRACGIGRHRHAARGGSEVEAPQIKTPAAAQVHGRNCRFGEADLGVGANLRFGKEWWVELNTGLGAHLQLHISNAMVHDQGARMTTVALSLLLSLTLN
jgi:hypothetical protein